MSRALSRTVLDPPALARALALRDLTDAAQGPHAMQELLSDVQRALTAAWGCLARTSRARPVVSVEDNYDRLLYPPDGAARDARHTRYVTETMLLRTHTSALIPGALRELAQAPPPDVLLVCPGLVYRRDAIDRLHTGEPHQVDLWRVRAGMPLLRRDLHEMIRRVAAAALPGKEVRWGPAAHPYTLDGLQIDVATDAGWVEIGECGLAHPAILKRAGMDISRRSGLAMGLGLDRILMLRKGLPDIRLLRSEDPRVAVQMLDLRPYRPVSSRPAVRRDLSIAVPAADTLEDLGDRVRTALGREADAVEEVTVLAESPLSSLSPAARERLGIVPGQKNVLVRVVLRALDRTLTHREANLLRDRIYEALHRGGAGQWAAPHPGNQDGEPARAPERNPL